MVPFDRPFVVRRLWRMTLFNRRGCATSIFALRLNVK